MLPSDTPRLPKWPFLVGDAALLGSAALIASRSLDPWSGAPLIATVSCVALGTVLGAIPFLTDYARKQDIALDDRQRALEELARTVATAAEQIGIAAQGLHTITELAQKNLKQAELLPHKLQDKVAELQQQLTVANDEEKEELERDLAALRSSESERLEVVVDKIQKAAGEWTKLQTSATSQLTALQTGLAALPDHSRTATDQLVQTIDGVAAHVVAELGKAGVAIEKSFRDTAAEQAQEAEARLQKTVAALEQRLTQTGEQLTGRIDAELRRFDETVKDARPAASAMSEQAPAPAPARPFRNARGIHGLISRATGGALTPPPSSEPAASANPEAQPAPAIEDAAAPAPAPESQPEPEAPKSEATPAESAPLVPLETPTTTQPAEVENASAAPAPEPEAEEEPIAPAPKPARRAKPIDDQPTLGLDLGDIDADAPAEEQSEFSQISPDEARPASAMSADGATRLLVTAYIGIG
ncbi:MAG: hypothetical protein KBG39_10110, partial [Opitutaceae bacterium]|nr:hypothetical protein [Opitutaceae bacterium]